MPARSRTYTHLSRIGLFLVVAPFAAACSSSAPDEPTPDNANDPNPDPVMVDASPETTAAIGVARWGITLGDDTTSTVVRGYDASQNPVFEIGHQVTEVSDLHRTSNLTLTWETGDAAFSIDTEDPPPGDNSDPKVEVLENTFPEDANGPLLVLERFDADTNAAPPDGVPASGTLTPASLFSDWASNTEGGGSGKTRKPLVNRNKKLLRRTGVQLARTKCLATWGCGKALYDTIKSAYQVFKSCRGVLKKGAAAEVIAGACDFVTAETILGPAVCSVIANGYVLYKAYQCVQSVRKDGKAAIDGARAVRNSCHLCK